jgi:pyruvate kinase
VRAALIAVELGLQRMSEVQEQMLWLCEAAHVPVVWATQVLHSLLKTGIQAGRRQPTPPWPSAPSV